MKEIPQDVSISTKRRNPHLYSYATGIAPTGEEVTIITKPPKRIRQSTKPLMNKLEQEWWDRNYGAATIFAQAMRFRLANGLWYKPDFVCLNWLGYTVAWEIKGPHSFRGGFENLKMAASTYPQIRWILTWKESGQWKEQKVLP